MEQSAQLRHLPPTAVRIKGGDLWRGMSANLKGKAALDDFRTAVIEQIGNPNCFLVSSGRAGLALILMAMKQMSGRKKVIVPAYVCPTVVQSVVTAGLQPVFCDMSPETLDFDQHALKQLIDSDTLAVVPVHLYGWAQDVGELVETGKRENFFVIEDAAQAFGAKFDGRMVGNLGDAGYYSMGRGKCIPVGHGGIITIKDQLIPALKSVIDSEGLKPHSFDLTSLVMFLGYAFATHPRGWWLISRTQWNPADAGMDLEELPPISIKGLSAVQAGIGTSILRRLGTVQATAAKNAQKIIEQLSEFNYVNIPRINPEAEPVFLRLPVVLDHEDRATRIFNGLNQVGVGVSRSYSQTIPELYAKDFPTSGEYPGASRLARCLLTLPTHAYLREEDIDRMIKVFKKELI